MRYAGSVRGSVKARAKDTFMPTTKEKNSIQRAIVPVLPGAGGEEKVLKNAEVLSVMLGGDGDGA